MTGFAAGLVLLAAVLTGCSDRGGEGADCPATARVSKVSGYCVPRYVSLKRDRVYARKGPGTDYATVWIYQAKGLPVQVVGETLDWRRICDPDGYAVWVHRSMVDGRRMVEVMGQTPAPLYPKPQATAGQAGALNGRSLAALDHCEGDWCKVRVSGASGWTPASRLWGVSPATQCR